MLHRITALLTLFPILLYAQTTHTKISTPDSITYYNARAQYKKVIPFAELWRDKLKRENGEQSSAYATALEELGNALYQDGNMESAEPVLIQAYEIRKKLPGDNQLEIASSAFFLGNFYTINGDQGKAQKYFDEALKIRLAKLGENHVLVATVLNNLGSLNMDLGNFSKADSLITRAMEIRLKTLGENNADVAGSYNNKGKVSWMMGNLPKAEEYYLKSLAIKKTIYGENHPSVGSSYNNLALVYIDMGDLPKGETYLLKGLEINKKLLGENNITLAMSYNNLGALYENMNRFADSEKYSLKALAIKEKSFGPVHPDLAGSYNNLGNMNYMMGNYHRAIQYTMKALNIWKEIFGPDYVEVAGSYINLGNIYAEMGQMATAESYYLQSLKIRKKKLSDYHPDMPPIYNHVGFTYKDQGKMDKAEPYFLLSTKSYLAQFSLFFPAFSDKEKELYLSEISPYIEEFKSFSKDRYSTNPAIAGPLYNHQMATKALLLNSSAKWKHRIKSSGDKKLFLLFTEWESLQNELASLHQSTDSTERAGIDSISARSEKMEKELSLRSENFTHLTDKKIVTWRDVQKVLKPGEAAIEMIRTRTSGIAKIGTDTSDPRKPTYKIKGLTDTVHYVALIIKPESKYPEMVVLKNGNDLEGKYLHLYENSILKKLPDEDSYNKFWGKIGDKLKGSSRVYFSPDGVFHTINLNTLQNPKTKKYLVDEKDIRIVTVTKDLIRKKYDQDDDDQNKLACLVGFPSYYKSGENVAFTENERSTPAMSYGLRFQQGYMLAQLPGTKVEVEKIGDLLRSNGWEVKSYTENKALEENLKESYKPRLLHLATHGYFSSDTAQGENPLLRSGLMLTGAGTTLNGFKSESREDGILTAYEAMNLNLDNTDLVVLSACETGLGEIKNGEGVYGLQRAFKVAGAKSIIMSLWKVDDSATQELMVSFYKNWLQLPESSKLSGSSKRTAFLTAQKQLKAKYPNPYYWGAFVMVGE